MERNCLENVGVNGSILKWNVKKLGKRASAGVVYPWIGTIKGTREHANELLGSVH